MKHRLRLTPVHILLIVGAVLMLMPFFWMVTTSLKTAAESIQFPPTWIPKLFQWSSFAQVFQWSSGPVVK